MGYILGLTVLGTVVREYGPETLQMSERGYSHRARESAGKRAGTPETRRCGYVGVWGTGGTLLVLSGALILTGTRPAGAAAYHLLPTEI